MIKKHLIIKASGELQQFNKSKLENSLIRAGADSETISKIIKEILPFIREGVSTNEIYSRAFKLLKQTKRSLAARYSIKKGVMELGPSGFPFEKFVAQLLKIQGFDVLVGQMVEGVCVRHEVDVIATSGNIQYLIECKYYNTQGKFANVKVPLYINSRVNDIIQKRHALPEFKDIKIYGWIVTNTRFTSDAEKYGLCVGLNLLSWDFPTGNSMKDIIEKNKIFPVTVLTSIDKVQKVKLIQNGYVICSQINNRADILEKIGLTGSKLKQVIKEISELCNE